MRLSELKREHAAGLRGVSLPASVALQAKEALLILGDSGISLPEAARIAVARVGGNEAQETFRARYDRAKDANNGTWSEKYATQMEALPRWLPESFMDRKCGTIDRAAVESGLLAVNSSLKRSSLDMKAARVLAIVGYRERHKKSSSITILSRARVTGLLLACESRAELRAIALMLFAGIRPDAEQGEISRLDWSDVGADEIYISGDTSKTSGDRHIPIYPRLRRLIKGHPKEGKVTPANWKRTWARIRKTAGITEHDVCRHTFASNLLALNDGNEGPVKSALGHAANSQTLFRHYRRAVTKKDGEKYFR